MNLDRPEALSLCRLEILSNIIQEDNIVASHPGTPAILGALLGLCIVPRKRIQPLHGKGIHPLVRFADPYMRRRDEDVKKTSKSTARDIIFMAMKRVALGKSHRVAQRAHDVPPALPELLQRGQHPRVWLLGHAHHFVEEPFAVYSGQGGYRPRQTRPIPGGLAAVKGLPVVWAVQICVERGKEVVIEGDGAALESLPCAVGAGSGNRVVNPTGGDGETEFIV